VNGGDGLSGFARPVRAVLRGDAATCATAATVAEAAAAMGRGNGAAIVLGADGSPRGIITDRDLRVKVVAAGRDPTATSVTDVMSAPLVSVTSEASAFDALVEMTRHEIHHIAVVDGGRLIGVLASDDLVARDATHPVGLARNIVQATSREDLSRAATDVTRLVGRLLDAGGRAVDIGRVVAELNDRMVVRLLALGEADLRGQGHDAPSLPYAWLVFGSEGRREQTLRTDQDNGLVYADPPAEIAEDAARYFHVLGRHVVDGLIAIGFPPCPGDAMASNAAWCQPLAVWDSYVRRWIADPSPGHLLAACMYFDLRAAGGDSSLAERVRDRIRAEAPAHPRFLGLLARDVVDRGLPVTLFGGISVHRSGPHRGAVDIKGGGCLQLVGAARVHALALGSAETNTVSRFGAASEHGVYTAAECGEIADAYDHLLRLRLVHQLERLAAGEAADNFVDPERLSHHDGLLLKDALKTVARVQHGLRERYATDFIPS
jgi:CBS domain-containing protein